MENLVIDDRWDRPTASDNTIALKEASGAARHSSWEEGVWMINDSGDSAMLYLLNLASGELVLSLKLEGLKNRDWEDMASITDSMGVHWLCIGDIGDNSAVYSSVDIYAIHEPELKDFDTSSNAVQLYQSSEIKHWNYVYEDGARDAEALIVDPLSACPMIWSKQDERNRLYQLPSEPSGGVDTARFIRSFPFGLSTSADCIKQDNGSMPIVLRSYQYALIWNRAAGEEAMEALNKVPLKLPYRGNEVQGESIWWTHQGWATVSEEIAGIAPVIWHYLLK